MPIKYQFNQIKNILLQDTKIDKVDDNNTKDTKKRDENMRHYDTKL